MKKIKFGSFPLIDLSKEDRHCIDNYSIKNFADLITLNTQMTHIQSDTLRYITPDVIMKYFNNPISETASSTGTDSKKRDSMKRAFKSLQNFHKSIRSNPFYSNKVTFPIYLENENKNGSHDYDFILLSNDLVQDQILDEIKYDDRVTLTFLFLKDMLYPETKLSNMGIESGYDIRGDMAKFIEFSKNNDTDPISAMVKLIKIAGMKKGNGTLANGLVDYVKKNRLLNEAISKKFFNLFGGTRQSGQIKDIHFLLNEIQHMKIAEFFDDKTLINKNSHIMNHDNLATQSSGLERQYMAQKTQEYNKILSMVDSLVNFNHVKDIMVDAEDLKDGTLKLIKQTPSGIVSENININYDKIINSVRNDYFNVLVSSLVSKTNNILETTYSTMKYRMTKPGKADEISGNTLPEMIDYWQREVQSVEIKIQEVYNSSTSDQVKSQEISRLQSDRDNIERKLNQLLLQQSFMVRTAEEDALKETKQLKSEIIFNTDLIQSELVGLLHSIEADIYDANPIGTTGETIFQGLMDVIGSGKSFTPSQLEETKFKQNLKFSIEQLTISILNGLRDTIFSKLTIDATTGKATSTSEESIRAAHKEFESKKERLEKDITAFIESNLYIFFTKLGREYGDLKLINAQKYAEMRTEKNPVIRRSVSNNNNFKTFILSEKVLVSLYDMLSYVDTQKYLAGLIAYPPSKISNELNQIKYVLNRLGLQDNPVFIIGEGQSVILSSPDFLSLTGSNIFTKITRNQMKQVCTIDYAKQLWNNSQMFKRITLEQRDRDTSITLDEVKKQQAAVKIALEKSTMAEFQHRKAIKDNRTPAEIAAAKLELENAKEKLKHQKDLYNATYKRYNDAYTQTKDQEHVAAGQPLGTSHFEQGHDDSYRAQNAQQVPRMNINQGNPRDNSNQQRNRQPWQPRRPQNGNRFQSNNPFFNNRRY